MYPACVDYTASPGMGDNYAYEFSNNGKCPKSDLGNWSIYIGSYGHPDYAKGVLIPGRQWIDTKMNIKGISMTVKEDKDLKSFEPWNVRFKCNDTDVRVTYHADMSLPRPDWHHKMPAPLKEFLETVHCEKN